ncbi:hypothetical protein DFJ77DRAFT_507620 [Powellomyces hirtus]|nr:hypothetical protein DFJ77DRAFT_507620 [Powellomyces hirtus]
MSASDRPQSAVTALGLAQRKQAAARVASAPASRRVARPLVDYHPADIPPRSTNFSRSTSAKSAGPRQTRTRRDSAFSSWTSRAASARAASARAALSTNINLCSVSYELSDEEFASEFRQHDVLEENQWVLEPDKANVGLPSTHACSSRATSAGRVPISADDAFFDIITPIKEHTFVHPVSSEGRQADHPRSRPRSAVSSRPGEAIVEQQQTRYKPPSLPAQVLTSKARRGTIAPFHESFVPQRRKNIPNEIILDLDAIKQKGIYPLLHREWIPATADVTKAISDLNGAYTVKTIVKEEIEAAINEEKHRAESHVIGKPPVLKISPHVKEKKKDTIDATNSPETPTNSQTADAVDPSKLEIDRQLIISNGHVITEAPGYAWFEEAVAAPAASKNYVLELLVEFCRRYKVDWAQTSCNKVFELLNRPFVEPISKDDLIDCFVNKSEIRHLLDVPEHKFHAVASAPTLIQSWWKMVCARRMYLYRVHRVNAATKLWRIYRRMTALRGLRARIKSREQTHYDNAQRLGLKLKREWGRTYETGRRTYIHFSHTIQAAEAELQVAEIGRVLNLHDQDVSVIFIVQTTRKEILDQMQTLFRLSFTLLELNRLTIIAPETAHLFRSPSSPASWILASHKTLRMLTDLGKKANCMIIPGDIGSQELELSSTLNIPLSTLPSTAGWPDFGAQCRIFEAANIPFAPGSDIQATDRPKRESQLRKLRDDHPSVSLWGIYIGGKLVRCIAPSADDLHSITTPPQSLGSTYIMRAISSSAIATKAAVVFPTACLIVKPNGDVSVLGTCDQAYDPNVQRESLSSYPTCILYPAQSTDGTALVEHAITIAKAAYKEIGLFGPVAVEFALLDDRELSALHLVADYTPAHTGLQTFMLTGGTHYKPAENTFENSSARPERRDLAYTDQIPWVDRSRISRIKPALQYSRVGIQFPNLRHPMLETMSWSGFLATAETQFDYKLKKGSILPRLSTHRTSPYVDMICIEGNVLECARLVFKNLNVMDQALMMRSTPGSSPLESVARVLATAFAPDDASLCLDQPKAIHPLLEALGIGEEGVYLNSSIPKAIQDDASSTSSQGELQVKPFSTDMELLLAPIPSLMLRANNPTWSKIPKYTPILPTLNFIHPRIEPGLTTAEYLVVMERILDDMDEARREQRVWENVNVLRSGVPLRPKARERGAGPATPEPPLVFRALDFMGPGARDPTARARRASASASAAHAKLAQPRATASPSAKAEKMNAALPAGPKSVVRQVFNRMFDDFVIEGGSPPASTDGGRKQSSPILF